MNFSTAQDIENKKMLNLYNPIRMPAVMERGEGCLLWDKEGKEYLDLISGGRAVNILGHCHPRVVAAVKEQCERLIHVSNDFYTEPQLRLAEMLFDLSGGMRAFFCNSGTEANEAAIKLARRHTTTNFGNEKIEIVAAARSFHGRTYGSLSATGQEKFQKGFGPLLPGFKFVPFNDAKLLKEAVGRNTCAVMLEPVLGESGSYPAEKEFMEAAEEACKENDALLVLDEVQSGMGRTGKFFAFEHYGVKPDIVALAKGLGGGVPIGAMLAREPAASSFTPSNHAATFGGTPIAAAAAVATLQVMAEEGLADKAARMGEYFVGKLCDLQSRNPVIETVRGKGLMLGLDLGEPIAAQVKKGCFEKGVLINVASEVTVRLIPALVITEEQADKGLEVFEEVLAAVGEGG